MATPLLIDTDMGIDDAVAFCLAMASKSLDVRAVVGVGGNASLDDVMNNIGRVLTALGPSKIPAVGRGKEPASVKLRGLCGADGLGDMKWEATSKVVSQDFRDVYRDAAASAADGLTILALGPLTNVATVLEELPDIRKSIRAVFVSGGAVWARSAGEAAIEFNFQRDPHAAAAVLSSGLPVTVVPLDVTTLVCFDESHVAHLAASGHRAGELSAKLLSYCIASSQEPGVGKAFVKDVVAAGSMLWPDLFLKTRMRLEVATAGPDAGKCKPGLGGDKSRHVDLLTAVNAADLLEDILELLCHEAFVV